MREGGFFVEHWAEFSEEISNRSDGRWRIADAYARIAPWQQAHWVGNCNGLMLITSPLEPHEMEAAEFYGEVWGGHHGSTNQRFILNGRGTYVLPEVGTSLDNCCYHYPEVPLKTHHLVRGINALQLAVDRGTSFSGSYMMDEGCLRAYLPRTHARLKEQGLEGFAATVATDAADRELPDRAQVSLRCEERYHGAIASVEFRGRYVDYDDTGCGEHRSWHGYTRNRAPVSGVGVAASAPFCVDWDTGMIPDQDLPIELAAFVRFRSGITYVTPVNAGQFLRRGRRAVRLVPCSVLPSPFASRAGKAVNATIDLSGIDLGAIETARLLTRVWDGGEGTVKDCFTLNGHPSAVGTGTADHRPHQTESPVPVDHLKAGENVLRLLSDTEHHGIEVLLPGPALLIRFAEAAR